MEKIKTSQLAKMVFLLLLLITPFVSTSMRPSYLYFLLNILIVVLGLEAGFLTAISGSSDDDERKTLVVIAAPINQEPLPESGTGAGANTINPNDVKPVVEKIVAVAKVNKMKRPPSVPSLFFIGGWEGDGEFKEEGEGAKEEVEEVGDVGAQELFAKAEVFIGNFYKQLKMQREESWRKIHGLYHKAF